MERSTQAKKFDKLYKAIGAGERTSKKFSTIILFYIIGRGAFLSMFRVRDPVLQGKLFALNSGILGIMAASYGNAVLGQMPTALMIYSSMAFLFLAKRIDNEIKESETELERLNNEIGNQTKLK